MTNQWVVTTPAERLKLDQSRNAEITFTVTNQAARVARTAFDIRTGDGVDTSWFTVDDPQRAIRPAASVPFAVRIAVPAQVAPGSYEFQARVCPPDAAPEESFVLSPRVLIEVPAPPAPPKRKWPWWLIAVAAGLLALVIGVVTWLVWPTEATPQVEATPSPTPAASTAPVEYLAMPKVIGTGLADATAALEKAGFAVGDVHHRFDAPGPVARQSLPVGMLAPRGSRVNLDVGMPPAAAVITAPANGSNVLPNSMPTLTWTQAQPGVTRWLVTVLPEKCTTATPVGGACPPAPLTAGQVVTTKQHRSPQVALTYVDIAKAGWRHNGWLHISVQPIDDLGNLGAVASVRVYLEH